MGAVAQGATRGVFATAEQYRPGIGRGKHNRAKVSAYMRVVTKGLGPAEATTAPQVFFPRLHLDPVGLVLSHFWFVHAPKHSCH